MPRDPGTPSTFPSPAHGRGGLGSPGSGTRQTLTDVASLAGCRETPYIRKPPSKGQVLPATKLSDKVYVAEKDDRGPWFPENAGLASNPDKSLWEQWRRQGCQKRVTALRMVVAPIFTDGDPEAQRGKTACLRSHSVRVSGAGTPRSSGTSSGAGPGAAALAQDGRGCCLAAGTGSSRRPRGPAGRESWGQRVKVTDRHVGLTW